MKTTLQELTEIRPSLDMLLDSKLIDTKMAYALSKFAAAVDREFKLIEKARNKYIVDHGTIGPRGPEIMPDSPAFGTFQQAMATLLEQEVELPVMIKIPFEKIPPGVLSPRAMAHLEFIIEHGAQ